MAFTPSECVAGGLVIGIVVSSNALIHGRVTGISGSAARALKFAFGGPRAFEDLLFVLGLMCGGIIFSQTMPTSFGGAMVGGSARIAAAGFAVGLGTRIGSGCTSGHGVCGLARLNRRSFVNVVVFMATAMATAALSGTGKLYGLVHERPDAASTSGALAGSHAAVLLMTTLVVPLIFVGIAQKFESLKQVMSEILYFFFGVAFAAGLALAKMTQSSKVIGFLDILSPSWDPSLLFVFVGALPPAYLAFGQLTRNKQQPIFCSSHRLPTNTSIDAKLVLGGVLFGIGWGLEGYCPGPALVNLGAHPLDKDILLFCAAAAIGMGFWELRKHIPIRSKS